MSEATQADYYRQALTLAYCQPNVVGLLVFHVSDEANGNAWQSGLFYADDTPKASLKVVRAATEAAAKGTLSSCSSAKGPTFLDSVTLPRRERSRPTTRRGAATSRARSGARTLPASRSSRPASRSTR